MDWQRGGISFPRVAVLGLLAMLTACGTTEVGLAPDQTTIPTAVDTTTTSTTTSTTSTTTSTTTTTTTTTTVPEVLPELVFDETGVPVNGQSDGVLVSDTGWILPILSGLEDGRHRVWTPCGRQADIGGGRVITEADIVIDPGHGGSEPGAVGQGGLREADLNLEVSKRVRDAFVGAGYSVVMTRQTDVRVPIVTRAEIGQALDPTVFL
ncbi:MAG: N-acetylmuramoyl-L-alanine amidase, partial [Actinomycetota bacterium]